MNMDPNKRYSAQEALEDEWLSGLSQEMLNSILSSNQANEKNQKGQKNNKNTELYTHNQHDPSIQTIAKNCLLALARFEKDQDQKQQQLKVQIQSIIANALMSDSYKQTLRKIFRIMDTSGDGKIDHTELMEGYNKIV